MFQETDHRDNGRTASQFFLILRAIFQEMIFLSWRTQLFCGNPTDGTWAQRKNQTPNKIQEKVIPIWGK